MLTLVTGATGLVGNNVVRLLLERGEKVRALARNGTASHALEGLSVEIAHGDVRDPETIREACRGVGRVIHAAAEVHIGWKGMDSARAINVEGTRNVAEATRAAGARLCYVSTVNTLGLGNRRQPADEETAVSETVPCPYVITKREAERVVHEQIAVGLDAVIVNPAFMLGPWDWKPSSGRMLLELATGWARLAPPGGNDFCDVRDVAAGILAAAERGQRGRRYILGGEAFSFMEAWSLFAEIIGVRPPWRKALPPGLWIFGHFGDLRGWFTGREPNLNSAAVALSRLEHHYSYARAAAELDYRPRPAREAAETAWQWFKAHGYA
jgi:dihydroflavonol-4-reductase